MQQYMIYFDCTDNLDPELSTLNKNLNRKSAPRNAYNPQSEWLASEPMISKEKHWKVQAWPNWKSFHAGTGNGRTLGNFNQRPEPLIEMEEELFHYYWYSLLGIVYKPMLKCPDPRG